MNWFWWIGSEYTEQSERLLLLWPTYTLRFHGFGRHFQSHWMKFEWRAVCSAAVHWPEVEGRWVYLLRQVSVNQVEASEAPASISTRMSFSMPRMESANLRACVRKGDKSKEEKCQGRIKKKEDLRLLKWVQTVASQTRCILHKHNKHLCNFSVSASSATCVIIYYWRHALFHRRARSFPSPTCFWVHQLHLSLHKETLLHE